jgi:hypothetical protein
MAARPAKPTYYLDRNTQKALDKMTSGPQKAFGDKFVAEYGNTGLNELITSTGTTLGVDYRDSDDKMQQTFQMLKNQAKGVGLELTEFDLLPVAMTLQGTDENPRVLITGDPRIQKLLEACGGRFSEPKAAALGVAGSPGELSQAEKFGKAASPGIKVSDHQKMVLRMMSEESSAELRRINNRHARAAHGMAVGAAPAPPPPAPPKPERKSADRDL